MTNYEAIQKFDSEHLAKFLFGFEVNTVCKVLSNGFVDTLDLVQLREYMDKEYDGFERLKFHEPPEASDAMTDRVYQLLNAPRRTQYRIRQLEAKRQAIEFSMMPSGIRYDQDKAQTSPVDQMPEAGKSQREIIYQAKRVLKLWRWKNETD